MKDGGVCARPSTDCQKSCARPCCSRASRACPWKEAAAVENCAVGTVKSRVFRARELLRAALSEER